MQVRSANHLRRTAWWFHGKQGLADIYIYICEIILKNLGIDILSASHSGFFNTLDFDGSGAIDIHELIQGLMRIHGAIQGWVTLAGIPRRLLLLKVLILF